MSHRVFYASATRNPPAKPVDFNVGVEDEVIADWDYIPDLHGWMEDLYRAKGGTAEDFYQVNLQLDAADLDALDHAVRSLTLRVPPALLFLGISTFLDTARVRLSQGEAVYCYSRCWWRGSVLVRQGYDLMRLGEQLMVRSIPF
jgi:hypothetical protein